MLHWIGMLPLLATKKGKAMKAGQEGDHPNCNANGPDQAAEQDKKTQNHKREGKMPGAGQDPPPHPRPRGGGVREVDRDDP